MEENNCYICNTITGNKYKVTNDNIYFMCSEECLEVLFNMKKILALMHLISKRYGKLIPAEELPIIFEGWVKPSKTKTYIKEMIDKGFLIKHKGNFLEIK